jgi:hypothetical protein
MDGKMLNDEIAMKRAEPVAEPPTTDVLVALLRDAAQAWRQVLLLERHDDTMSESVWWHDRENERGHKFARVRIREGAPRGFIEYWSGGLHPGKEFEGDTQPFLDWLEARGSKLTSAEVGRLIAVARELRPLVRPVAKASPARKLVRTNIGADAELCWRLLWLDALGVNAPDIAAALSLGSPPKRLRIWRLRKQILEQLARTIEEGNDKTTESKQAIPDLIAA